MTELQATSMNCEDARDWFSALPGGQLGLTELALVEAHRRQCAECRQADLRPEQPTPALGVRCLALLTGAALAPIHRALAGALQAVHRAVGHSAGLIERLRALLVNAVGPTARVIAGEITAVGLGITRPVARVLRDRPAVRGQGAVLAVAFGLYALEGTYDPFPSASLADQRSVSGAPSRVDQPVPVPGPSVATPQIVGRLAPKDRNVADRDFSALLAEMGGAELGRRHRLSFTAVEVVVSRARYDEFAHGLARIGSWRLQAARFPLPDEVHMTIRVSE